MGDRRCGYCREYGHNFAKCNSRLTIIDNIRKFIGAERKGIMEMMLRSGVGVGAIVTAYSFGSGEFIPCLVTQDSIDSVATCWRNSFLDFRSVKYSKQVRTVLRTGTLYRNPDNHESVDIRDFNQVSFNVTPLSGCDASLPATMRVLNGKIVTGVQPTYSWERYGEILSDSYDGEVNMDKLMEKFRIHERLTRGDTLVEPIL